MFIATRTTRTVLLTAAVLLTIGIATLALTLPAALAAFFPTRYGFTRAADDIYIEGNASPQDSAVILARITAGQQRVRRFWGRTRASPRILVCRSEACFRRLGGGRRKGMSILDVLAILSPRGTDPVIAAHELSMNEMLHRIGWLKFLCQTVPVWFNEGIAMIASDDRRYLGPPGTATRCLVPPPSPSALPGGPFEWNRMALRDTRLYAKAACATSRWLDDHGGNAAAVELIDRLAAGQTSFAAAWQTPPKATVGGQQEDVKPVAL
jgi:hypothetical protein